MKLRQFPKTYNIELVRIFYQGRLKAECWVDGEFTIDKLANNEKATPYLDREVEEMYLYDNEYRTYRILEIFIKKP